MTGGWGVNGGVDPLDSTEIYDPLLGSWAVSGKSGAKLPRPMGGLVAEVIDDRILIFGIYTYLHI